MARKTKTPPTLDERITEAVATRLASPEQFCNWSELLHNAERVGRIKKSKLSPLAYCLTRYIQRGLEEQADIRADWVTMDSIGFWISTHTVVNEQRIGKTTIVEHPDWLFEFFEPEENEALLDPADENTLMEVLQRVYEWCREHGYIKE
jgi:hypothetical protein